MAEQLEPRFDRVISRIDRELTLADEQNALANLGIPVDAQKPGTRFLFSEGYREEMADFFDGFIDYCKRLDKLTHSREFENMSDEDRLILGAAAYINYTVRDHHARPTHRLQLMDRVQSGNYNLVKAAREKYDAEAAEASLIGFIRPYLDKHIQ
ncbi:MAG TPA: hypothetical protein VH234_05785, partial [Candidatus Saccharimonadales bacterium]|nr:hypothetical protein [Candidatus Saccharimonadales bacterium]